MDKCIEHIRSIQLVLWATCFVLVTTVHTSRHTISTANDQLDTLQKSLPNWNSDIFYREFRRQLAARNTPDTLDVESIIVPGDKDRPSFSFNKLLAIPFTEKFTTEEEIFAVTNDLMSTTPRRIRNLDDLRSVSSQWNNLNKALLFVAPVKRSSHVYVSRTGTNDPTGFPATSSRIALSDVTETSKPDHVFDLELFPGTSNIRSSFAIPKEEEADYFLCAYKPSTKGNWQLAIPVNEVKEAFWFNPLGLLVAAVGDKWRVSDFEHAFPELSESSKGFEQLKLGDLKRVLEVQTDKDYKASELFGIQFSMKPMLVVGALAILLIQMYLYFHLIGLTEMASFNLAKKVPLSFSEPWIGTMQHEVVRGATIVLIALVPPGSVLGLIGGSLKLLTSGGLYVLLLIFFASSSVGVLMWGRLSSLWLSIRMSQNNTAVEAMNGE